MVGVVEVRGFGMEGGEEDCSCVVGDVGEGLYYVVGVYG